MSIQVEVIGGPQDGAVYAFEDGTWMVTLMRPTNLLASLRNPDDACEVATETVTLLVQRRVRGNRTDLVVVWPREWA